VAGDSVRLQVYVPPDVAAELQAIAAATGATVSQATAVLLDHTLSGRGTQYMRAMRTLVARSVRR
jgi:hypothetical protein